MRSNRIFCFRDCRITLMMKRLMTQMSFCWLGKNLTKPSEDTSIEDKCSSIRTTYRQICTLVQPELSGSTASVPTILDSSLLLENSKKQLRHTCCIRHSGLDMQLCLKDGPLPLATLKEA